MCRGVGSWGFRPLFRQRPGVEVFCGVTIMDAVSFLWIFRVKFIKPSRFRLSGDVGDGVRFLGFLFGINGKGLCFFQEVEIFRKP